MSAGARARRPGPRRAPCRSGGRRRRSRLADVEHVQVPAAATEPDHLPVRAPRSDRRSRASGRRSTSGITPNPASPSAVRRMIVDFPRPGLPSTKHARVVDQVRVLKPADRVTAQRRAGDQAATQRHADHRGAGAGRERPQPAHLNRRRAPLAGRLHHQRAATTRADPTAEPAARQFATGVLRRFRNGRIRRSPSGSSRDLQVLARAPARAGGCPRTRSPGTRRRAAA